MARKKLKFERIKIKDRHYHEAEWEICLGGPVAHTDCATLCGKTGWHTDHDREEVDQNVEITCETCLAIVEWMKAREL